MMWELVDAVHVLRELRDRTERCGWYPALGGSVLTNGYSDHDLDVVFTPKYGTTLSDLHIALREFGWNMARDAKTMRSHWKEPDQKHVEEWATVAGRRIDVIVMLPINEDTQPHFAKRGTDA